MDYKSRSRALMNNPIACVSEFISLMNNVFSILFGIQLEGMTLEGTKKVRTKIYTQERKGLFGNVLAAYGVVEAQKRNTLHYHFLLYGGLPPYLLQKGAQFQQIRDTLSTVLEQLFHSEFPRYLHVQHCLYEYMKDKFCFNNNVGLESDFKHMITPTLFKVPPSPLDDPVRWKKFCLVLSIKLGIHKHSHRCNKAPKGLYKCAVDFKRNLSEYFRALQLYPWDKCVYQEAKKRYDELPPFADTAIQAEEDPKDRDRAKQPILMPDERIIFWEQKRPLMNGLPDIYGIEQDENAPRDSRQSSAPFDFERAKDQAIDVIMEIVRCHDDPDYENTFLHLKNWLDNLDKMKVRELYIGLCEKIPERNAYVVEHNRVHTAMTGCNSCLSLLGSSAQSDGAMKYICEYIHKCDIQIAHAIPSLYDKSMKYVKLHPSVAGDTGTTKRTAQHILTRIRNTASSQREICDTQAALILLG